MLLSLSLYELYNINIAEKNFSYNMPIIVSYLPFFTFTALIFTSYYLFLLARAELIKINPVKTGFQPVVTICSQSLSHSPSQVW